MATQEENKEENVKLSLADLMDSLDWGNRYAYKGSMTTPPCARYVYWNVIRRVYPVTAAQVAFFREQQQKLSGQEDNYREVQTGFNADVIYVESAARKVMATLAAFATLVTAMSQ